MVTILKNKALELEPLLHMMTGSGPAIFAFCEDLVIARKFMQGWVKYQIRFILLILLQSAKFLN